MAYSVVNIVKPNLYDLFGLHGKARGRLVSEKDEAETVFSLEEEITPFEIEQILAEFLS